MSIIVSGWTTSDNAPPSTAKLIDLSGATQPASIAFTVAANPSPGDFTLKVALPSNLALGKYAFELDGVYSLQTESFVVAAPITPTATAQATPTPSPVVSTNDGGTELVLAIAVGVLLVLAIASLVVASRRRQGAQQQREAPYNARRSHDDATRW